jgi:hypothetical protein
MIGIDYLHRLSFCVFITAEGFLDMGQDAVKRVRSAITSVMDQYGVPYQDVRKSNHPAIRIVVGGQTRTITYGGGDPRAHLNARTQTRRMLAQLGLIHNECPPTDADIPASVATDEGSLCMENPYNDVLIEDAPPDEDTRNVDTNEDMVADTVAETTEPISQDSVPRTTDAGYVIFNSVKYNTPQFRLSQGRFFAIELDRDLIAAKGTYLVIPIDIPDTVWDMPPHEFRSCFTPVAPEPSTTQSQPVEPANSPIEAPPIPSVDVVVDDEQPAQYPRSTPASEPKPGVSPQMGRVLLAIQHLHQQGEVEVAGPMIQSLLSPVDAKQVSGMLSAAIKLRYVTRGSALDAGRGTRYKLNAAGRKLAQTLGTWPYDHRGLAVPPWLRESLRMSV